MSDKNSFGRRGEVVTREADNHTGVAVLDPNEIIKHTMIEFNVDVRVNGRCFLWKCVHNSFDPRGDTVVVFEFLVLNAPMREFLFVLVEALRLRLRNQRLNATKTMPQKIASESISWGKFIGLAS